jgi:glutaconyl-CoA decarboxylase
MKRYRITVEGKTYEVEVEELDSPEPAASRAAARSAPSRPAEPVQNSARPASPPPDPGPPQGAGEVTAPMSGKVISLKVEQNDSVRQGDLLLILEAMKMENEIRSAKAGSVSEIFVQEGDSVNSADQLMRIE